MAKRKMISKTHYNYSKPNLEMRINLSRFEKQYEDAQIKLDSMVMTDMKPYMPGEDNAPAKECGGENFKIASCNMIFI